MSIKHFHIAILVYGIFVYATAAHAQSAMAEASVWPGFGGPNAVVTPTAEFNAELASTGMRPEHRELIPLLSEPREILAICAGSELADFDVIRMVWVLLTVGALSRLA